jgi:hypothetical protein
MPIFDRSAYAPISQPLPGEIWELNIEEEFQQSKRYVAIVREPQADNPQIFPAMLLSSKTAYLSDIDILIPAAISGLDRDILAETWNVGNIPVNLLARKIGNRLSRNIYDLLLSVGDVYHSLSVEIPSVISIEKLGLKIVSRSHLSPQAIDNFHQQEDSWLQSLNSTTISTTDNLVRQTIEIERDFIAFSQVRTCLSQWFQEIVEPEWQTPKSVEWLAVCASNQRLAVPTRSLTLDDEITETLALLKSTDTHILRQSIERLGKIAQNNDQAIQSLATIINTTPLDEILWLAVASLRQIDPEHPNLGIRQSRSISVQL